MDEIWQWSRAAFVHVKSCGRRRVGGERVFRRNGELSSIRQRHPSIKLQLLLLPRVSLSQSTVTKAFHDVPLLIYVT